MKLKKVILSVSAFILAISCTLLSACKGDSANDYVQQLNVTESTAKINNPDQGFYRPIYVKMTESGVSYNQNIINSATQLYHLRIDISAFSAAGNNRSDLLFAQAALDGLSGLLSYLKEKDKNAIVRFAYDPSFNGSKDKEPNFETILKHVEQVCPVLNGYKNTVTAIEVGLIGPWGEMHSSAIANSAHITPLVQAFLNATDQLPVLVRTPKMIYDYLGITVKDIEDYTVAPTQNAYRLGLFNDGYLGSESDLGTYTDRQKEIAFLSGQTEHLPFGGEVVIPNSPLHNIDTCLPEMNQIHLSYLNVEWNNQVIDKWKNSFYTENCGSDNLYYGKTAYEYIENRLGYRFVLTKSVFSYSDALDKLTVKLNLQNVGFGNLNREKSAKIIIADEQGQIVLEKDAGIFAGSESVEYSADLNLENGTYNVYLRLYGEEADGIPLYCLQFANDGIWNDSFKANHIGSICRNAI